MKILVRAIGALAAVMFVVAIVAILTAPQEEMKIPLGLHMPALAIQFAPFSQIQGFLGTARDSSTREQIRQGLHGDYFFIAMYWLLFVGMSALLATRSHAWAVWAGVVAAICATSAAIFDVVENLRTAALLDAVKIQPELVDRVASAGFGKWLLISLATLVLSLVFVRRDWLILLAVLYVLIGVTCIYGLLLRQPRFVELSFLLNLVGLPVVAIFFSGWPQKLLDQL
jgi:hypothetical protein